MRSKIIMKDKDLLRFKTIAIQAKPEKAADKEPSAGQLCNTATNPLSSD